MNNYPRSTDSCPMQGIMEFEKKKLKLLLCNLGHQRVMEMILGLAECFYM